MSRSLPLDIRLSHRQSKSKEKTCFRSDSTRSSTGSGAWIHVPEVVVSCGTHAATYSSNLLVSIAIYLDMLNTKKCRFITLKYFFGQIAIMLWNFGKKCLFCVFFPDCWTLLIWIDVCYCFEIIWIFVVNYKFIFRLLLFFGH